MQLTHSFVIPASLEETWAHFQDISSVAQCFPGAKVTSAEGDDFQGTAKVKLGPVALQYAGSGSFTDRDEAAHRMVFEAKGKDKRGNGTAGATVKLTFAEEGEETRADVVTDLSITGKPAQFGSRMMQEVSDKLLGQFVDCLQQQVGEVGGGSASGEPAPAGGATSAEPPAGGAAAIPTPVPAPAAPGPSAAAPSTPPPTAEPVAGQAEPSVGVGGTAGTRSGAGSDDALDLGTTVLPVIARMYRKQIGAGLAVVLVLWLLRRWLR